jgi:hypothetical protein
MVAESNELPPTECACGECGSALCFGCRCTSETAGCDTNDWPATRPFDTTVVQDVRGVRRFEYVVRPTGPRFTLVVRGDSADDSSAADSVM